MLSKIGIKLCQDVSNQLSQSIESPSMHNIKQEVDLPEPTGLKRAISTQIQFPPHALSRAQDSYDIFATVSGGTTQESRYYSQSSYLPKDKSSQARKGIT